MIILVLLIATALAFDFTNGFHDTGNAMATSIATGALKPKTAVLLAGVLNLVGAFLSVEVAVTVTTSVLVDNVGNRAPDVTAITTPPSTLPGRDHDGKLTISYTLSDADSDLMSVSVQFRVGAGGFASCQPDATSPPTTRCVRGRVREARMITMSVMPSNATATRRPSFPPPTPANATMHATMNNPAST